MAATLTTSNPTTDLSSTGTTRSAASTLRRTTLAVGVAAAVATTAVAAGLQAAGVSFEIDGKDIPMAGFAQIVFLSTLVGGLLAGSLRKRSAHARSRFVQITGALTVLSCIPSVAVPPTASTKLALVVTHVVAAAIVIPVLARRLAD